MKYELPIFSSHALSKHEQKFDICLKCSSNLVTLYFSSLYSEQLKSHIKNQTRLLHEPPTKTYLSRALSLFLSKYQSYLSHRLLLFNLSSVVK